VVVVSFIVTQNQEATVALRAVILLVIHSIGLTITQKRQVEIIIFLGIAVQVVRM
jgi:hypothetical protein